MVSPWCRPVFCPCMTLNLPITIVFCALESTTQWRLSAIKVKLELELVHPPFVLGKKCVKFTFVNINVKQEINHESLD